MNEEIKQENNIIDKELSIKLRPNRFDEYIGQERIKTELQIAISAAKTRNEMLEHVLLYGPPGLGKTSLAMIIAKEMCTDIITSSGMVLQKTNDIIGILSSIKSGTIIFIDEIHRMPRVCEEILYTAMEDNVIDVVIGKGNSAKTVRIKLPPFTLIGATTMAGRLTGPLRDRFGSICRLDFYSTDELSQIIKKSAEKLGAKIEDGAIEQIAKRGRGTPRIANRMLKRIRDFVQHNLGLREVEIIRSAAVASLEQQGIDELGLDWNDRNIIKALIDKFNGGPVGIATLSAATSEDESTITDVIEPYLLQIGFISKQTNGRVVLEKAYEYFGIKK